MLTLDDDGSMAGRQLAESVDELLAGARRLGGHRPDDARSGALFEQVEADGQRCIVKYVHPDYDFTMRVSGDIGCRPRRVWEAGLVDVAPDLIDHATLGAAPWGRNGWGVALLMRDVSAELVPVGGAALPEAQHLAFVDHCAGMAARMWGWQDELGLLPHRLRWAWFGPAQLEGEAALGFPEEVPRIAAEGWARFAERAPSAIVEVVEALRRDTTPLSEAVRSTPQTFLHGDWKLGNLGSAADGRTILLDWAYPGEGPACHELAWYLALNRARLPGTPRNRRSTRSVRRLTATEWRPTAGGSASSASACSARSCSSAGRNPSAPMKSLPGGATPPSTAVGGCSRLAFSASCSA